MGAQNDILTLDPHSQNHATTSAILQHTYEGLTRYTKTYAVEPCLATGWQYVTPTQLRFTLRKNVKFQDGSPFTADDVVFSYTRVMQPQGTMQIYVAGVKEVKKVDDFTVDMILSGPNPVLLRNIADFRIMSRAWSVKNKSENTQDYKAKEDSYASRNTNGTGQSTTGDVPSLSHWHKRLSMRHYLRSTPDQILSRAISKRAPAPARIQPIQMPETARTMPPISMKV